MRLELDRVGAGFRRRFDQLGGERNVSVVIDAGFSDDEARRARPDGTIANPECLCGHVAITGAPVLSWKRFWV
jgi:hypothetical protein